MLLFKKQTPSTNQGRRGAPRYHPASRGWHKPYHRAASIVLTGEIRLRLLGFTGDACQFTSTAAEFSLVWCGNPRLPVRVFTLPDSLADGLLLLLQHRIQLSVDPVGFEPTTSSMPLRRAPNCAMGPGNRVDLAGFEPATSSVRLMRAPNCATGPCGR